MSHSRRRIAQGLVAGLVGLVVVAGLVGGGETAEVVGTPRPSPGPTCTPTPVVVFLPRVRVVVPAVRPTVAPPATMRPTLGPTVDIDGQ